MFFTTDIRAVRRAQKPLVRLFHFILTFKISRKMEQSNISRDHIAMEAMKIIMQKTTREMLTPVNRLKRWLGMDYDARLSSFKDEKLAANAYDIADAMVAEREKRNTAMEAAKGAD